MVCYDNDCFVSSQSQWNTCKLAIITSFYELWKETGWLPGGIGNEKVPRYQGKKCSLLFQIGFLDSFFFWRDGGFARKYSRSRLFPYHSSGQMTVLVLATIIILERPIQRSIRSRHGILATTFRIMNQIITCITSDTPLDTTFFYIFSSVTSLWMGTFGQICV